MIEGLLKTSATVSLHTR